LIYDKKKVDSGQKGKNELPLAMHLLAGSAVDYFDFVTVLFLFLLVNLHHLQPFLQKFLHFLQNKALLLKQKRIHRFTLILILIYNSNIDFW